MPILRTYSGYYTRRCCPLLTAWGPTWLSTEGSLYSRLTRAIRVKPVWSWILGMSRTWHMSVLNNSRCRFLKDFLHFRVKRIQQASTCSQLVKKYRLPYQPTSTHERECSDSWQLLLTGKHDSHVHCSLYRYEILYIWDMWWLYYILSDTSHTSCDIHITPSLRRWV